MTYIEFFEKSSLENICACLTNAPERVILLGDKNSLMKKHIEIYKEVFGARGYETEFINRSIPKYDLARAVEKLQEIVDTYEDCAFGITGGDELLTLALGIVYERNPDKNIQIHRFALNDRKLHDIDRDGTTIYKDVPTLTVKENINLYGGDIVFGTVEEDKTYNWDITEDFRRDIAKMWDYCKGNTGFWNFQVDMLYAMKKVGSYIDEQKLCLTATYDALKEYLTKRKKPDFELMGGFTSFLMKNGLITEYRPEEKTVTVAFKNAQVKKCLTKAGQVFELKIYLAVKDLKNDAGEPFYDEAVNGVVLDWDGKTEPDGCDDIMDTENEIDVLAMTGITPVFISCKNGGFSSDELYKLSTVSEQFSGPLCKKALFASNKLSTDAGKSLSQRASDMHIMLIDNVKELDDDELSGKLKNIMTYSFPR